MLKMEFKFEYTRQTKKENVKKISGLISGKFKKIEAQAK